MIWEGGGREYGAEYKVLFRLKCLVWLNAADLPNTQGSHNQRIRRDQREIPIDDGFINEKNRISSSSESTHHDW